jgi:hypothetical protein
MTPYRIASPPPADPPVEHPPVTRALVRAIVLTFLGASLGTGLGSAVSGCGLFAQAPAITSDVVAEIQCVEGALAAGAAVYEDIALQCVPLAVADVVTIVQALASPADGGAASPVAAQAKLVHHRVGAAK